MTEIFTSVSAPERQERGVKVIRTEGGSHIGELRCLICGEFGKYYKWNWVDRGPQVRARPLRLVLHVAEVRKVGSLVSRERRASLRANKCEEEGSKERTDKGEGVAGEGRENAARTPRTWEMFR